MKLAPALDGIGVGSERLSTDPGSLHSDPLPRTFTKSRTVKTERLEKGGSRRSKDGHMPGLLASRTSDLAELPAALFRIRGYLSTESWF